MADKRSLIEELVEALTYEEAMTLVQVARAKRAREKPEVDWSKEIRTCPKCGHTGFAEKDFGLYTKRGKKVAQNWCRNCRSETSNQYRQPPR